MKLNSRVNSLIGVFFSTLNSQKKKLGTPWAEWSYGTDLVFFLVESESEPKSEPVNLDFFSGTCTGTRISFF